MTNKMGGNKASYWIEHPHESGENWEYSMYECSNCHEWSDSDSNYCPNCGAKMGQESMTMAKDRLEVTHLMGKKLDMPITVELETKTENKNKMTKSIKKLMNLVNKYPNLPVISMVEPDVVCDDCHSWWKANIKFVSRDFIYEKGESIYIKSIDDAYDVLTDYLDEMTDKEIEEKYNDLPWKEVIIVWVGC